MFRISFSKCCEFFCRVFIFFVKVVELRFFCFWINFDFILNAITLPQFHQCSSVFRCNHRISRAIMLIRDRDRSCVVRRRRTNSVPEKVVEFSPSPSENRMSNNSSYLILGWLQALRFIPSSNISKNNVFTWFLIISALLTITAASLFERFASYRATSCCRTSNCSRMSFKV